MTHTLILGGGFGGVPAARRLRQLLPDHPITLIDKRDYFMVGFRKTDILLGKGSPADYQQKLATLEPYGIRFLHGDITAIDPAALAVTVNGQTLHGDALIVALGADLAPETIPGFGDYALNVYDAASLSQNAALIRQFKGGRVLVGVFGIPYKCPPAPYEMAILLREQFHRWGVQHSMDVFTPQPTSMPMLGSNDCATIDGYLFTHGIRFHASRTAVRVESGSVHFDNGSTMPYDLLLGVAPHRPPKVVRDSGLTGGAPWVKVGRTLETAFPNVYAIGDVNALMMENGKPLPKAGVFAHGEGETVAERIAARLMGRAPDAAFDGQGGCFLEVGNGKAVMVEGQFLAAGGPEVRLTPAAESYVLEKDRFERQRVETWFG
jgi:sulfide:quinone oxidoreductase